MLDAFEARIVELLSDRLSEVADLEGVLRPHDGLAEPKKGEVQLRVRLLDARPRPRVGDDERARLGEPGSWRQRVTLELHGRVELELRVGPATTNAERLAQRGLLIGVLDRLLVVLADEGLRAGSAFAKQVDQGFELDGFRFAGLHTPGTSLVAAAADEGGGGGGPGGGGGGGDTNARSSEPWRSFTVLIDYAGRFWPVGEEEAGVAIAALPIRTAVLPAGLPTGRWVRAGEFIELEVEVALSRMSVGEGEAPPASVMARLRGASPGELLGDAVPGTSDWISHALSDDAPATITLRCQAPEAVSGKAEARIELALERETGGRVGLGELTVEVRE